MIENRKLNDLIPIRIKDKTFYGELVCEVHDLLHIKLHGYLCSRLKNDIDIRMARKLPKGLR